MKILAAVDLDELTVGILANACIIANAMGADAVDAMHVEDVPLRYAHVAIEGAGVTIEERNIGLARKQLEKLLARAGHGLSLPIRPRVVAGDPAEQVVAEAKRGQFDLVVLGTHRRHGVSRMLMGSVAEEVVRHAPCPVLVVPTGTALHEEPLRSAP